MNVETDVNPNYFFKNIFDSIFVSYSNELQMFKKTIGQNGLLDQRRSLSDFRLQKLFFWPFSFQ